VPTFSSLVELINKVLETYLTLHRKQEFYKDNFLSILLTLIKFNACAGNLDVLERVLTQYVPSYLPGVNEARSITDASEKEVSICVKNFDINYLAKELIKLPSTTAALPTIIATSTDDVWPLQTLQSQLRKLKETLWQKH